MKNLTKITALLLAMLLSVTSLAFCVFAEPDTEEPGNEGSGNEESGGENSSTDEPTPSNNYTVDIVFTNAGAQSVSAYFNELFVDGAQFSADAGQPLDIKLYPNEDYEIVSATFKVKGSANSYAFNSNEGTFSYHIDILSAGATYEVTIDAKPIPVDAKVSVWAKDDALADIPFDAYIDSAVVENVENNTVNCKTGDKVTLTFNVENFDVSNAFLKINGTSVALEGNSYTFTVENTDNAVQFGYNIVPVNFVVNNGPADIKIQPEDGRQQTIPDSRTVHFKKGASYTITFGAGAGRIFDTVEFVGCEYEGEGAEYTVIANQETTITVNLSVDEQLPDGFNVNVNCGENGEVTVNDSDDQTVKVDAGDDVVITAIPDEGYVVDTFTVNGNAEEFIDNVFVIENINRNINIRVTFKKDDGAASKLIGVDDINWNAETIIINIRGGKKVAPEVFEKISETKTNEAEGKIVEFQSELGTVHVPLGKQFVGEFAKADLRIKQVTDSKTLKSIKSAIESKTSTSFEYKALAFNFGIELPKGTYLTFNFGTSFAGYTVDVLEFDVASKKFTSKGEVVFDDKGVSGKQDYNNESILLCSKKVPPTFVIESIIKNDGGTINPLGKQTVNRDSTGSYAITANSGYVIKQLLVNGKPVSEAEGKNNYTYHYEAVGNITIEVEFEPVAFNAEEENGTSAVGTVIVIVIIVLVALAGAGMLFYVKWSQEKF
jgi:hypothetical protein